MSNRLELVKQFNEAFWKQDRVVLEDLLALSFTFSAPPDPLMDRDAFFEKCLPHGDNLKNIKYIRLLEHGDEVVVTHEFDRPDSQVGRNTDIVIFDGDKISRIEVYFGWDNKA